MILDSEFLPQVKEFFGSFDRSTIPAHELEAWDWILENLPKQEAGFYISALMNENDEIDILNCSYTINKMWGLPSNSIPEWVLGLTRSRHKTNSIKTFYIESLMLPVFAKMERQNRNAFYMVRHVPKYVDWSNVDQYMARVQPRIGNIIRYTASIQHLLSDLSDLDGLSNLHKRIAPPEWPSNKKVAIVRHELKSSYRGQ